MLIFAKNSQQEQQFDSINKNPTLDQILSFSISTFWDLIQDDTQIPLLLTDLALSSLQEILKTDYCNPNRIECITKCIENLMENKSIPQSLQLILDLYSDANMDMQKCIRRYNLIELLLKDCELYLTLVTTKLQNIKINGNIGEMLFMNKYPHHKNIEIRLQFFDFIMLYRLSSMNKSYIFKLWSQFIIDCKFEYEKRIFLDWLSNDSPTAATVWLQEESEYLFEIISNSRSQFINSLENQYYKCFAKYFKLVNLHKSKEDNIIIGLESLWECVSYSQNENIRILYSELVISSYINWNILPEETIADKWKIFIDYCMNLLKKGENVYNHSVIANLIRLIILFIDTADGNKYNSSNPNPKNLIEVMLKPGNISVNLEINEGEALGYLKKRISNAFNIPFEGFSLCSLSKNYNTEKNTMILKQEDLTNQLFIHQNVEIETPKAIIANNKEYIDLLFSLLAKENPVSVNFIWDLLMILPLNINMRDDIFNFNTQIEYLLDYSSIHKFIYSLQIVQKIITEDEGINWFEKFCQIGGFAQLFKALLNIPTLSFDQQFIIECFEMLFEIFSHFQLNELKFSQYIPEYNESTQMRLIERITRILEGFAQFSNFVKDIKKQEKLSISFLKGFTLIENTNANYFIQVVQHIKFKDLIFQGVVKTENMHFQNALAKKLLSACESSKHLAYTANHPHAILLFTMINCILPDAVQLNKPCKVFYQLLKVIIKQRSKKELSLLPFDYHGLFQKLSNFLHENYISGLLDVLRCLIKIFYEEKEFIGQTCGVVKELLEFYLFSFLKRERKQKCIDRKPAFNLLCTLAQDTPRNVEEIFEFLTPLHK